MRRAKFGCFFPLYRGGGLGLSCTTKSTPRKETHTRKKEPLKNRFRTNADNEGWKDLTIPTINAGKNYD